MADDKKREDYVVELGDKQPSGHFDAKPAPAPTMTNVGGGVNVNNPVFSIFAYCGSSILMTCTNKYVLGGHFNLNFFLLCVQVSLPFSACLEYGAYANGR